MKNYLSITLSRVIFAQILEKANWPGIKVDSIGAGDSFGKSVTVEFEESNPLLRALNSYIENLKSQESRVKRELIRSASYLFAMLSYRSVASEQIVKDLDQQASRLPFAKVYHDFVALEERGDNRPDYLRSMSESLQSSLVKIFSQTNFDNFKLSENEFGRIAGVARGKNEMGKELELRKLRGKTADLDRLYPNHEMVDALVKSMEGSLAEISQISPDSSLKGSCSAVLGKAIIGQMRLGQE
ncbi:MAG: hypothetical protein KDD35_12120 [Bdellovibrionales bacterium]|nr:hypothetical protein [Bdellovibrionales bacterium]